MLKRGDALPDYDHVVRHVPWSRLRRDENDGVIGILPQAFSLRDGEESLSVNWLEYFSGDPQSQIKEVITSIRNTKNVGGKSAFCIANVGKVRGICKAGRVNVRIVFAPNDGNPSHSLIRYLSQDDLVLLEELADEFSNDLIFNSSANLSP